MLWIALLIVVVLILRNISTSHIAANVPMHKGVSPVNSTPTAGDSFCSGRSFVAGVGEPTQNFPLQCNMIRVGTKTAGASLPTIPVHISLPAIQPLPPPLAIQSQPIRSGLYGGGPITAPRPLPISRSYTL